MRPELSDDELKMKACDLLSEHLGPVDTMRFLMLIRESGRDYQSWRDQRFKGMGVAEIVRQIRAAGGGSGPDGGSGS